MYLVGQLSILLMHLSEHALLGFGSCGIITTFNNINLQITLVIWSQWSCLVGIRSLATARFSRHVLFLWCTSTRERNHLPECSGRWEMKGLLSFKQPPHPCYRFDSGQLHLGIDTVWYFVRRRCCNCRWYKESSYFY